jgi:hypothetical protein
MIIPKRITVWPVVRDNYPEFGHFEWDIRGILRYQAGKGNYFQGNETFLLL